MTIVVLILGLILLGGAAMAWELLRLNRAEPETIDPHAWASPMREESYRPMVRLFARADLDAVVNRPDLIEKLVEGRKRTMRLFLSQLRGDFMRAWTICRLLTPVSDDPTFAFSLVRQLLVFHGLLVLTHARCLWAFQAPIEVDVTPLVDSFSQLRQGAAQLLQATDPLAAGASA